MKKSETAIISGSARLGVNVKVGHYAVIEDDVEIGDNVEIGPGAVIMRYTTVGSGCRIHAHAVIGDLPQDTGFKNVKSFARIGENCVIREGVTIHRGTEENSATEIGPNCYLMCNSHCAHNVKLGDGVIMANGTLLAGYVEVGDRVFISGNCVVHQFVHIGRLAMLSGGSGISQDLPPFCTTKGLTTNMVLGLNTVGMRRAGITPDERMQVKRCFKILYRSGLNIREAVVKMKEEFRGGPAADFYGFIEKSKRGICMLGVNESGH